LRKKSKSIIFLETECSHLSENHKVQESNAQNMKIVRYEDMAMDPIKLTNSIYDFLGLQITPEIEEFLKVSTQVEDNHKYRVGEEFLKAYSTSRKSSENINKWRLHMDFNLLKEVQKRCSKMMETYKYMNFIDEKTFKNISLAYYH
jgi:hypothetical protein